MAMELASGPMEGCILENGRTGNSMGKVPTSGLMEESLLENLKMVIVTVRAATSGPMDVFTLENGKMANAMAKELTSIPMDTSFLGMTSSRQARLSNPNVICQRMTKCAASALMNSVVAKRGWCYHAHTDFIPAVQTVGSRRKARAQYAGHRFHSHLFR